MTIPDFVIDTTAPTLTQVTAITTPSNDTTPSYVFTSGEAGTLTSTLGFSTSSSISTGSNQTVTFNALSEGTYTGTTITVTDAVGNAASLTIPTFVIDTTAPASFTVGTVESTGGTVENGYWNATNTGLDISLNLPNDSTLVGGTIQLLVRQSAESPGSWTNLDSAYTIQSGDINGNKTLSVNATVFEGSSPFLETFTMEFNATITDSAGNATTGTESSSLIVIDQTAPSFISVAATDDAYKASDVIDITVTLLGVKVFLLQEHQLSHCQIVQRHNMIVAQVQHH